MERPDYHRLYRTKRWKELRAWKLRKDPYCQCPHHKGEDKSAEADVVDHITKHEGELMLFWAKKNLRSMTKQCHDRFKQSQEKGGAGFLKGCDESGWPLSDEHHWNQ